jgi:hypothetical protein
MDLGWGRKVAGSDEARAGMSGSQSVDRALQLLALIGREPAGGLPLVEIVAGSGLNKPTARRLLLALIRAGLVEQEPTWAATVSGLSALNGGWVDAAGGTPTDYCTFAHVSCTGGAVTSMCVHAAPRGKPRGAPKSPL